MRSCCRARRGRLLSSAAAAPLGGAAVERHRLQRTRHRGGKSSAAVAAIARSCVRVPAFRAAGCVSIASFLVLILMPICCCCCCCCQHWVGRRGSGGRDGGGCRATHACDAAGAGCKVCRSPPPCTTAKKSIVCDGRCSEQTLHRQQARVCPPNEQRRRLRRRRRQNGGRYAAHQRSWLPCFRQQMRWTLVPQRSHSRLPHWAATPAAQGRGRPCLMYFKEARTRDKRSADAGAGACCGSQQQS